VAQAPSAQSTTYPIADDVMQLARAMVNDMLRTTSGQILTNKAPFTVPLLNSAIRRVQRYFANNGLQNYVKDDVILPNMPPAASNDPSVQVSVSVNGYFDGVQSHAQPALPTDLILPLCVWERQSGAGANFVVVDPVKGDGLPSRVPGQTLQIWEWRNDALNFIGSNITEDLRIRYEAMIPAVGTNQDLTQVSIPLRDAHEALAGWMIYFYAFARGSVMRTESKKIAEEAMDEVVNRYVRKDQRIAFRSHGFSAGGNIDGALSGSYK